MIIYPKPLKAGDKVAILSPASHIKDALVDGACNVLAQWGFEPVVCNHCKGRCGTYSASSEERLADLTWALNEPSVRAIMCSRGGYGAVHLLHELHHDLLTRDPKWLIGFSDISALHATWVHAGIASMHAPMAKHLCECGLDDCCNKEMLNVLMGGKPQYEIEAHEFNRQGVVKGQLVGGNLAVLSGLLGTPFNILEAGKILFIEDIGEDVYKIERMLYALQLGGVLEKLKGLIVGQFTEYKSPDRNGESMYDMIRRMVAPYDYPVAFNFPVGHVDDNRPLIEGADVELSVTSGNTTLKFL